MTREEAKLLKTIELFASQHSNSNNWQSPVDWKPTDEEENSYDTAWQDAYEWRNNSGCLPKSVTLENEIDDGDSHDVSRIKYYTAETAIGTLHIYSYNNNAWGHCDVLSDEENPTDIEGWLKQWDRDNMENWMLDYIGESND